jgi:hypothetical protein
MVARELGNYELDLVGVKVRWEMSGTERAEDFTFFFGEGNECHQIGQVFFVHKGIITVVRRVKFVSGKT